jgi:hypothetical protein
MKRLKNFLVLILFLMAGLYMSNAQTVAPNAKIEDQKQQNIKDKQMQAMIKQQDADTKKHMQHQTKEVRKRLKKDMRETNMAYRKKRWYMFIHNLFKKKHP